jgi:hypothetical protein
MNKKGILTDKTFTNKTPKEIFDAITLEWKNYFAIANYTYDDLILYNSDVGYL